MPTKTLYLELRDLIRQASYDEECIPNGRPVLIVAKELRNELAPLEKIDLLHEHPIKVLVLLSECYDYYGRFHTAAQFSRFGKDILSTLPTTGKTSNELNQSKVRLGVAYARSLYRQGGPEALVEAERILENCCAYVGEYIKTTSFPNHGTLGEIAYTLGRVYRQQQRLGLALREFHLAIQEYHDRIAHIQKHPGGKDVEKEAVFSKHKIATILALGVGWCNYTRGQIREAIQGNLIAARMLLAGTGDELNRAYADVVFASASRALARKEDKNTLNEIHELVARARGVFEKYGHRHYEAGADLELALINVLLEDKRQANRHLRNCESCEAQGSLRWICSAKIVRSRMLRYQKKYEKARKVANEALDLARKRRDRLAQIDALITRSETYAVGRRENHDLAIADLQAAIELNQTTDAGDSLSNPKVHAVCHLHLAKIFLSHGKKEKALASFGEWEKVSMRVDHAWVRKVAAAVSPKISHLQILRVDAAQKDGLKYKTRDKELRIFLLSQAKVQKGPKREIAAALGISRPRLNRWLEKYKSELSKLDAS